MPVKTKRPWVQFLIDNPVASITLMRSIRKKDKGNTKYVDPRVIFERFLREHDFE